MAEEGYGLGTTALHGARRRTEEKPRPHAVPIYQSSAFTFPDTRTGQAAFLGSGDYIYTRQGNPTIRALEERIAALESLPVPGRETPDPQCIDCCFFASGMAAIGAVALGVAGGGGRIVAQEGIYGTAERMLRDLPRYGMEADFAPAGDLDALRDAVGRGRPPALVHIETPANPLLQVTEIGEAARIAHEAGAMLVVDGTFSTPALLRPLAWGADLVVHSTTKFISGHGVALGGAVSGTDDVIRRLVRPVRKDLGGAADPFAAWLTLLGLLTLPLRMARYSANAAALAEFLRGHETVVAVHHPDPSSLPPGQLEAGGPMLSFQLAGGAEGAARVMDRLRLATLAATLGTLDTLVQHPYSMSHVVLPEERRRAMGIGPGLLRVSVGLEDEADIIGDFRQALEE
ncbi:MAG: trans-sulfuration enzyme family protein [Gemmatimonadota bacterium]